MSNMSSMSRESKKRQLRRQIVPSGPGPGGPAAGEEEDSREVVQKAHRRAVRRRLRTAIILLILAALGAVLIYQFSQYHQYEDFQVVWEKNLTSQDGGGEAVPQADSGCCGGYTHADADGAVQPDQLLRRPAQLCRYPLDRAGLLVYIGGLLGI